MPDPKILKAKYGSVRKITFGTGYASKIKELEKDHREDTLTTIKKTVNDLSQFNVGSGKSNHPLKGKLRGYYDIHIEGNLILVYRYVYNKL